MTLRAPKQWALSKEESYSSFEAWRSNLIYNLSLDRNFARFLIPGVTWLKRTNAIPLRGFVNDGEDIGVAVRLTAAQKVTQLELMLGQIANYCPIISRSTFIKNSTSISSVWQAIRLHFGFQSTGGHFLDFAEIKLQHGEKSEDLYQRLNSFIEDNLLKTDSGLTHHGETIIDDEDLSPSLENIIILIWLKTIHSELPKLVKQRYGTELRSRTLASIKPEISQALDSLLEELQSIETAKVFRSANFNNRRSSLPYDPKLKSNNSSFKKSCPLCKQAGRNDNHFLSKCSFLPPFDKKYLTKVRHISGIEQGDDDTEDQEDRFCDNNDCDQELSNLKPVSARRVNVKQSPSMFAFYKHHPICLTIDTGAETNLIRASLANYIGCKIEKSTQSARLADGHTNLEITGECHLKLYRNGIELVLDALIVANLDVDILAGIPFMFVNDISVRPAIQQISIGDHEPFKYGNHEPNNDSHAIRRTHSCTLRAPPIATTLWPGEFLEMCVPDVIDPDSNIAIQPHFNNSSHVNNWPSPCIVNTVDRVIRLVNESNDPLRINKNEHVCQIFTTSDENYVNLNPPSHYCSSIKSVNPVKNTFNSELIELDHDNLLSLTLKEKFKEVHREYDTVFSPSIKCYNGAMGPIEAVVNIGPVQPPQRKGRLPQYDRGRLVELQNKFDEFEKLGIFARPEDLGVVVEYLNPSFLVKKASGDFRLVTAFSDVGRYSKPQPSLMPDVDSTIRNIGSWKYLISTDLTKSFYQIPLCKESMKYCGVATPFKGIRVYTRSAMGMPGSETALEELMCRILGDLITEGFVCKIADNLYCGGNTPEDLLNTWKRVLFALDKANLGLSATKTFICPKSTVVLGWIWTSGEISASPHRISTLVSCPIPETVKNLRSFIGAYKMLSRVVKNCAHFLDPLDHICAGQSSQSKILWTDELRDSLQNARNMLSSNKSIALPKPSDQLWIVTDGSVKQKGMGATLYVTRDTKPLLAGFFSAKLKKHQLDWLPCEVEALSITASVKHFSPYIIQSDKKSYLLTDSKPCVQAFNKLCRGEFSSSPRVTTYLSIISRYQMTISHLAGSSNIPSDFSSRNAPECDNPTCQICSFVAEMENCVVREISIQDIISGKTRIPFASRSAWLNTQHECQDLRRVHAHLTQGTRPSKKLTNIKDIKRYLNVCSIGGDGLVIVKKDEPLAPTKEQIVIPRNALDGLLSALHIKFNHPTKHQLRVMFSRYFFALNLDKSLETVSETCHLCTSLKKAPSSLIEQDTCTPPDTLGISFAADVLKRYRQLILVVRESVSSYTSTCLIDDETAKSLKDGLVRLIVDLKTLGGPPSVVRVDPSPGFSSLSNDPEMSELGISLEMGRIKNVNKNPVAEKAIEELGDELLRIDQCGGPYSAFSLSLATSRLNSRIRSSGLSAREIWTQRDQFTMEQLPISDLQLISNQHLSRLKNHPHSEKSKSHGKGSLPKANVDVGDLVYLWRDKDKTKARNRYLVTIVDGNWCDIRKFVGSQLRSSSYKVKRSECFKVPPYFNDSYMLKMQSDYFIESDDDSPDSTPTPNLSIDNLIIPEEISRPLVDQNDSVETGLSHMESYLNEMIDYDPVEDNNQNTINTVIPVPNLSINPLRRSSRIKKEPQRYKDFVLN